MVDQPEGRPKSPGPGKVKPVTKKHSVSKPYERPSSSRGVLDRVREFITPVTPGWLKDLVLRPPQTTSVTDALEQTVAEVQNADEKEPEDFKKALKSLTLPITEARSEPRLPYTTERMSRKPKKRSSSILDVSELNTTQSNNVLEETLGEIKWSTIRPAVKDKYSFSVTAFNTPSKSPNLSSISIHSKSLARQNASPFTNRSRVSFGGNSLQRSLLNNRTTNNSNTSVTEDKKPIKVKPISRGAVRPGVTSNTAKKILEQLESLSRPLGHLPSSRPSTPSSRPCSRASTPLSLSRPSTPQHQHPYKAEKSIPIRSLTSTPHEKVEKVDRSELNYSTSTISSNIGGKIKRTRERKRECKVVEEDEELVVPDYQPISVPKMEFKPIDIDNHTDHKPIRIVNQTTSSSTSQKDHVPLKEAIKSTIANNLSVVTPMLKRKSVGSPDESSDSSGFSFSAPLSAATSILGGSSLSDSTDFSFGAPINANKCLLLSKLDSGRGDEGKVEISLQEPPGSWSCVPCKLSNPSTMTRCSGCEAPNATLALPGLFKTQSPLGIKRAPITPMKPAYSPKQSKPNPVSFGLSKIKESDEETKEGTPKLNPLVKFSLPQQSGWCCDTCLLRNKDNVVKCIACETDKPVEKPKEEPKPVFSNKLSTMANPLLKFKKVDHWSCDTCMLSNPPDLTKCKACETPKPGKKEEPAKNPLLAFTQPAKNPLLAFAQPAGWNCDTCLLKNDEGADKCKACETPKPGPSKPAADKPKSTGVFQTLGSFTQSGWSCDVCMLTNQDTEVKCKACETPKPGAKIEESKKEEKKTDTKPSFSFGIGAASSSGDSKGGFEFKKNPAFDFGSGGSESSAGGLKFGVQKDGSTPTFGVPAVSSSDKPSFSFGVKTDTKTEPSFSFGTTSTDSKPPAFGSTEKKEVEPKPAFSFGAPAETKTAESKPTFNFGGTPASSDSKPAEPAPAFSFGSNATKTEAPPAFQFGSDKKDSTPAPGFNFGGTPAAKAEPFKFGATSAETKPATGFNFGGTAPGTAPASGFSFGGATPTAPAFNFGAKKSNEASTTAAPVFNFGGSTTPKPAAAPGFQFGGQSNDNGDNNMNMNSMDATSNSPTGFSSTTNGPGFSFGANTNSAATPGFSFGGSTTTNPPAPAFGSTNPAPAFGSTNTTAPAFGASNTSSFTSTNNSSTPGFSFGQNTSAFGQSSTTTQASTGFSFGGATKPATTGFNFGGTPQTGNQNSTTGFSFGGSTTPKPTFNFGGNPSTTDNKPFSFGASNSNPAPAFGASPAPAPSIGSSTPIPAPSFNFGGATSTPNNAGFQFGTPSATPTQNAFNPVQISSTTGRRIRKAVRRTKR